MPFDGLHTPSELWFPPGRKSLRRDHFLLADMSQSAQAIVLNQAYGLGGDVANDLGVIGFSGAPRPAVTAIGEGVRLAGGANVQFKRTTGTGSGAAGGHTAAVVITGETVTGGYNSLLSTTSSGGVNLCVDPSGYISMIAYGFGGAISGAQIVAGRPYFAAMSWASSGTFRAVARDLISGACTASEVSGYTSNTPEGATVTLATDAAGGSSVSGTFHAAWWLAGYRSLLDLILWSADPFGMFEDEDSFAVATSPPPPPSTTYPQLERQRPRGLTRGLAA